MLFHHLLQKMLQWVPSVVFLHFLLKFKTFWRVFSLPKRDCKSLCVCVCVCVCVHPLNKDTSQAIIGTFFQYILQKMVGWVALRFVIAFCWGLNRLKCDGQCLFLSYCNSCSACEMSFLTGKECPGKCAHCRSPRQKIFYVYVFTRTVAWDHALSLLSLSVSHEKRAWYISLSDHM